MRYNEGNSAGGGNAADQNKTPREGQPNNPPKMTDLSPQAQAVSNAAKSSLDWEAGYLPNAVAAAAIRAAAEELQYRLFLPGDDLMVVDAKALFNLANELEVQ